MEIKNLQKATKVLGQIEKIDHEIIRIEKIAMLLADKSEGASIKITAKNASDKTQRDKIKFKSPFAADMLPSGFGFLGAIMLGQTNGIDSGQADNGLTLEMAITDSESLMVLGILINSKNRQRNNLLKQLERLGVKQQK